MLSPRTIPLFALLALSIAAPAAAQGVRAVQPYEPAYRTDGGYGYAGEFVRGTYIGAPLTRVPRPSQIVPTPWSYGTYGVPTVSGVQAAPAGHPTLTVINARGPRALARRGDGWEGGEPSPGIRVIEVQVPRR